MSLFFAFLFIVLFFVSLVILELNVKHEIYEDDTLKETIINDYETARMVFNIYKKYNKENKKLNMKTKFYI